MDLEENRGSKLFQDSVHGVMKFPELVVKFIDTKEFQRLRYLKQLSTTYLVYPAAAHNRFEHSLGVSWLAGEWFDKLKMNSPNEWKKIFKNEDESKIKLAIQIAALLHDIGHGPFSHTWERFIAKSCGQKWEHEETSCKVLELMLFTDSSKTELTEVGKLFKKEFGNNIIQIIEFIQLIMKGTDNPRIKNQAFLYQIVANKFNDIDVDKFDYFLRDAQHLNIGVSFDYKRLMSLSRIELPEDEGMSHIAFRDVEKYSIEGMFRVRADLHVRAYQHRVAKCLEAMLIDALIEADLAGFKVGGLSLSKVHDDPKQFLKLSDSIQEMIQNSVDESMSKARKILARVLKRDLYKTVDEWKLDVTRTSLEHNKPPSGLSEEKLNELERELEGKYAISQVCVNQGKYYDPMKNVRFYPKDGKSDISKEGGPSIRMDLPFYKIYVFEREKESRDAKNVHQNVRQIVQAFLKREFCPV